MHSIEPLLGEREVDEVPSHPIAVPHEAHPQRARPANGA
jgi:hypothetical protein